MSQSAGWSNHSPGHDSAGLALEVLKLRPNATAARSGCVSTYRLTMAFSWRLAMVRAMRAASRPTPWICSDDFE